MIKGFVVVCFFIQISLASDQSIYSEQRKDLIAHSKALKQDFDMIIVLEHYRQSGLLQKAICNAERKAIESIDENIWFEGRSIHDLLSYYFCACSKQRCKVALDLLKIEKKSQKNKNLQVEFEDISNFCNDTCEEINFSQQQKSEVTKAIAGLIIVVNMLKKE